MLVQRIPSGWFDISCSPPCQLSASEDSLRLAGSSHKELLDVHQRSLKERVAEVDQLQAEADRMRAERMQAVAEVNSRAVLICSL